jgi:hypothetical protein
MFQGYHSVKSERQQGTEIKRQFLSSKFKIPANKARKLDPKLTQ